MRVSEWFAPLRVRDFRLFFVGQSASQIGAGMAPIAVAFAVLAHGTATDVGLVLAAETVPMVILLLVGGVIGDRQNRRTLMLQADLLRTAAEIGLGAWVLFGQPPLYGFMLLAGLMGVGQAFFSPAQLGIVPQMLSDEYLQRGNALNGISSSAGYVVGPALAGIIIATSNPGWAIMIDGLSFAISVITLAMIRTSWTSPEHHDAFMTLLRNGWRELWSKTWMWVAILSAGVFNFCFAMYVVLGPVVAKASLGGARTWGFILAMQGVGAVVAGLTMLRVHPKRPLFVAVALTALSPLPMFLLASTHMVVALSIASFLCGASFSAFSVLWNTVLQQNVDPGLLSRVSAYDWFGSLALYPIGMAAAGPLARLVGIRATLLSGGIICLALVAAGLCIPSVRNLQLDSVSEF